MALDIGEVRVGIAVSDPDECIASPLAVVSTDDLLGNASSVKRLMEDWEPDLFLCGLPYSLTKDECTQAQKVKEMASKVSDIYNIPCEFVDERLSSLEAKRNLREKGMSEREMRGKIDMIAASLFLQTWLDARRAQKQ